MKLRFAGVFSNHPFCHALFLQLRLDAYVSLLANAAFIHSIMLCKIKMYG